MWPYKFQIRLLGWKYFKKEKLYVLRKTFVMLQ